MKRTNIIHYDMEMAEEDFLVQYYPETCTLTFQGRFRLSNLNPNYKALEQFCERIVEQEPERLVLNFLYMHDMNETAMYLLIILIRRIHDLKKIHLLVSLSSKNYRQDRLQVIVQKMGHEYILESA